MYATRAKIIDIEAQNATLIKKVEDLEVDKGRAEVQQFQLLPLYVIFHLSKSY
ncbi:hypothetical protein Hanom_Chr06g00498401 [Helianthus anomalus]